MPSAGAARTVVAKMGTKAMQIDSAKVVRLIKRKMAVAQHDRRRQLFCILADLRAGLISPGMAIVLQKKWNRKYKRPSHKPWKRKRKSRDYGGLGAVKR